MAAAKNKVVKTFDVGQAFLNSEMSEKEVHIVLEKEVAETGTMTRVLSFWLQLWPSYNLVSDFSVN